MLQAQWPYLNRPCGCLWNTGNHECLFSIDFILSVDNNADDDDNDADAGAGHLFSI